MTKLADLKRCPSCHSADIIDNGHPTFPWRCVPCDKIFVTPYVMSAAPATPAATPMAAQEEEVLFIEAHKWTDAAHRVLQCKLGCKRLTYSGCELLTGRSCDCECHKVWAAFDEICHAKLIAPSTPAAAQPQRESEQRNVSKRSVAGTCDSPFVAAGSKQLRIAPQIINRCELQYGHAGQHKNGNASWGVQRESEQPEQALREAKEALDIVCAAIGDALCSGKGIEKAYANSVAGQCKRASQRIEAALSPQTDSQEPR